MGFWKHSIQWRLILSMGAYSGLAGRRRIGRPARCRARYLEGVRQQQNALTTSIAVLDSGNYFTGEGLARVISRDQVLEIDIDKGTRLPTLFINQRIQQGGKTLGVCGLGFSLKAMSEMIRDFRFGERGQLYKKDCQTLRVLADDLAKQMGSFRL